MDRAALDAAIALGIEHGGWCPRGRLAEDGRIPDRYLMDEMASSLYWQRTEQNVVDSDGTLILYRAELSGGTELTHRMSIKHGRPHLLVDLDADPDPAVVQTWLRDEAIGILNVAGPRESSASGITRQSREFLQRALAAGED